MPNTVLTSGLALPNKTFMAGVKKVWLANWYSGTTNVSNNVSLSANSSNVVTAITVSYGSFYAINLLKEAGEFHDNPKANPTGGLTSFEPTLSIYLSQYSTAMRNQILLMAQNKLIAIVQDRNNQYWLAGYENGLDMIDGATAGTGKVYASDQNGYSITFTGQELQPAYEITSTLIAGITSI